MDLPSKIQLKIYSSSVLVDKLKAQAAINPKIIVISSGKEKDPTKLGFQISDLQSIVTILEGTYLITEFAKLLFEWLKQDEAKTIVLETTLGVVKIQFHSKITVEEIRTLIKKITGS